MKSKALYRFLAGNTIRFSTTALVMVLLLGFVANSSAAPVFATGASMAAAREGGTATLLPNGKMLISGGYNSNNHSLASVDLFDPGQIPDANHDCQGRL